MGNRHSSNRRYHHSSADHIPKASSAPSMYSANLNMDESPTTIRVASKTSPTHKSSNSTNTITSITLSKMKHTASSKTDTTTATQGAILKSVSSMSYASSSSSAHYPKSSLNSTNVKSTNASTNTTATHPIIHQSSSNSSVSIQQQQQPDNRSGNSTPTSISHQSSIESIAISPRKSTTSPISSQNNSTSKLIRNSTSNTTESEQQTSQQKSSSPPSPNKWFMGNEESVSSIKIPNRSSKNLLEATRVMHVESVEDFSLIEEPEKEKKEVMHHSVTLPDIPLPSSADFQAQDADHPQRQRSNSFAPSPATKQIVFLAVQNNAHASSRRKLKLSKPQSSLIPEQGEICTNIQAMPKMEEKTITTQSEVMQQNPETSDKKNETKKGNITNLKLDKISKKEESSIDNTDTPLFSPVKSSKEKSVKRKQKGSATTKLESTNSSTSDNALSRSSISSSTTTTSMAQSLFSSSDERKSFCSAALDFQKNWFNELMGRREQVTVEQHSDSLHNPSHPSHSYKSSPFSIYSKDQSAAAIFDTRRRHSVFESKNITVVPLIAVSCPPNPAQSLDHLTLDHKNGTTTHLSVNTEKKARIAKKKRNLNNASPNKRKSTVSASCNYSNLSSYRMTANK
ncbi:predicted protein [Naegleria gruberi]|uniref:Predicted protein n=1 Tax=Naegleria gruberi TaxID=5762 RepID=D2VZF8_NAEGR|nr:uncharacterized protein NAEGRDRAFT_74474 [Naegleria gruberi]EFC37838.1 predicted protein [Naegleria gruberi]|eukprot:XP_002670582.1 predicted protein [Naegleria gruberi strain NEG-M]